ncbi:hypothetical protein ACTJKN_16835 [Pedobacter sp. 22163]|uniref:hypothetical protein n=1 Tax=Pedobacter sp. 22163 TaxID=3453883 RepID=UPI003F872758
MERKACIKHYVSSRFTLLRFPESSGPRCCRVTLQPGLTGQNSLSFSGMQGANPLFINPIGTDADFPSKLAGGKAGLQASKNLKPLIS